MAIQAPEPDFGQTKCPDCDVLMKPVTLTKEGDEASKLLECPKCGRKLKEPTR
jgi:ribosomal protein S27E